MRCTGTYYVTAFISTGIQLSMANIFMAGAHVFHLSTKAPTMNEVGRKEFGLASLNNFV